MNHPDTTLLSAYMDGDLSPREVLEVEEHLGDCDSCSELLGDLRAIQEEARGLPDRDPFRDLWPAIARAIQDEAARDPINPDVIRLHPRVPEARPSSRRGVFLTVPRAVAAGLVLALLSGSLGARIGFRDAQQSVPVAEKGPNEATATWVSLVEQAKPELAPAAAEVVRLERILDDHQSDLDPVTVSVLQKNLEAIDRAIRESLAALREDPGNRFLESNLERAVLTKSEYLRDAASLVTPAS
jgi:hypothetical protein